MEPEEQQAEADILAAFNASDGAQPVATTRETKAPEDIDAPDGVDTQEADAEAEKTEPEAEQETEEDYVEIVTEEGKEPERLALKEVLSGYREFKALGAQTSEIVERVQQEAVSRATEQLRQVEEQSKGASYALQAAMQLLQAPQPPDDSMLDPASTNYNPEGYHRAFAQFQRSGRQYQQAMQVAEQLANQAQAAQLAATQQRETLELQKLARAWPEFDRPETLEKFVSDMGKAYGYSPQELDASLNDHRNALVARDALAYRALKAKSGDVRKAVEEKAPKLVRTKQEAKASPALKSRDAKGQFLADTKARALKSQSDEDWANHFAALSRAGRI